MPSVPPYILPMAIVIMAVIGSNIMKSLSITLLQTINAVYVVVGVIGEVIGGYAYWKVERGNKVSIKENKQ